MNSKKIILQIFSRAPIPGSCKTRLIPFIGKEKAAVLQRDMLISTIKKFTPSQFKLQLWCSPDTQHELFVELAKNYNLELKQQTGSNLGEIMAFAAKSVLSTNAGGAAVLQIGTDSPPLNQAYLEQAINNLASYDYVIGPCEDGGYALLAFEAFSDVIFNNIKWGTRSVKTKLVNNIMKNNASFIELATLWDVDTIEDYQRL